MTVSIAPIREYLLVVEESALNTPAATVTIGTNAFFIRLVDGNSFDMTATPIVEKIPYGGGFAVTSQRISDHYELTGNLKTKLYPSQAAFLLGWGLTRFDGSTSPWATTEATGDLASCSIYHAYQYPGSATYLKKQYSGVKVSSLQIDVSRESTSASLTLGLKACQQVGYGTNSGNPTTLCPIPTEDQYPAGPYTFNSTAGNLTLGGALRTLFRELSFKVQNHLVGQWYENPYLSVLNSYGRDSMLDGRLYLKASPEDRVAYEALTAGAASLEFNNGTNTLTLTFNGANQFDALKRDLPLASQYEHQFTLLNIWDPTANTGAGGDLSFSTS